MKRKFMMLGVSALMVSTVSVVGVGAGVTGAGASGKLTTTHPFKVFSPTDVTGALSGIGNYWAGGLKAATKYINEHGGIMGREVEVTYTDDHSVAQTATTITTSALSSGQYQAVIPSSAEATPIVQVANRFKTLEVGAGGYATMGNGAKYPYLYSMNPPQQVQGAALACLTETKYHPKQVAYLYVNTTTFPSSEPGLTAVWKKYGTKVVASEPFTFAATTIAPQVEKIQSAKPTVLIVAAFFASLSVAIKGIDALHYTVPIAANTESTADSPDSFLSTTTKYPTNQIGIQWAVNSRVNNELSAAQKEATKALQPTTHGTFPVALATYLYTWEALSLVKWAATKGHSTKTPEMAKELDSLGANKSDNTNGPMAANPGFTTTTHWLHTTYYAITILGKFTAGTFPTTTAKPIKDCVKGSGY